MFCSCRISTDKCLARIIFNVYNFCAAYMANKVVYIKHRPTRKSTRMFVDFGSWSAAAHSDCSFFAPCINIRTYLLSYLLFKCVNFSFYCKCFACAIFVSLLYFSIFICTSAQYGSVRKTCVPRMSLKIISSRSAFPHLSETIIPGTRNRSLNVGLPEKGNFLLTLINNNHYSLELNQ